MKNDHGFTLVESLVVMAVLGELTTSSSMGMWNPSAGPTQKF
jgi:prepilin-type N-terminal cleavage/methylation domain-containing protein